MKSAFRDFRPLERNCDLIPSAFNITQRLTAGISALYIQIQKGERSQFEKKFTNRDGNVRLGDPLLPLFGGRYKREGIIGEGTFSQLIIAEVYSITLFPKIITFFKRNLCSF